MRLERPFLRVYSRVYDYLWDHALTDEVAARLVGHLAGADGRVLELGSGTGLITRRLLEAGLRVVPTEPDPSMRARLLRRLPGVECAPVALERVDAVAGGYGAVIAVNVLHMVPDARLALNRMLDLGSEGALVIVATPTEQVSLPRVIEAMTRRGVGWSRRIGFFVVHLLLSPLRACAGAGVSHDASIDWPTAPALVEEVDGVTEILIWRSPAA